MKGLVVYDSVYGNTKQIAEAIAEQIRAEGHNAELVNIRKEKLRQINADFMFVGSPTRMARMTWRAKRFLKKVDRGSWGNKPICTFDTVLPGVMERNDRWGGTAAQKLHDLAKERGLNVHFPVLHTVVTGIKGPLASDAIDKAKNYTHELVSSLEKKSSSK